MRTERYKDNYKNTRHKKSLTPIFVLALALIVIIGGSIGGTLAWLTDKTTEVTNTFTVGNIAIKLEESWNTDGSDNDTLADSWSAKIIPGNSYEKDPKVTVLSGSEDCWLFVTMTVKNNTVPNSNKTLIQYEFNNEGWQTLNDVTYLEEGTTVYYRDVSTSQNNQSWNLLKNIVNNNEWVGGSVKINSELTKEDLDKYYTTDDQGKWTVDSSVATPTISFQAFAIQKSNFSDANSAWAEISKTSSNGETNGDNSNQDNGSDNGESEQDS